MFLLYSKLFLSFLLGVLSTAAEMDSQNDTTTMIPDATSCKGYNIFNENPESVKTLHSENYHDGMGNYKIE